MAEEETAVHKGLLAIDGSQPDTSRGITAMAMGTKMKMKTQRTRGHDDGWFPELTTKKKKILHESLEEERHQADRRRRSIGIYYQREVTRTFFHPRRTPTWPFGGE